MARYFLDSSALVKRYHTEAGTPVLDSLFADRTNRLLVSGLALVEACSAFARLVRERILKSTGFDAYCAMLDSDVVAGILAVSAVSPRRLADASSLLRSHGVSHNLRTLDAIHLATANALHARHRITAFVGADKKLLAAASACGLAVLDVG